VQGENVVYFLEHDLLAERGCMLQPLLMLLVGLRATNIRDAATSAAKVAARAPWHLLGCALGHPGIQTTSPKIVWSKT